jgi:Arc/MetJ-type ribon-helix-helix transcriptional regulator
MMINLTPEQEQRIQKIISSGAYDSVEEVVDAALVTVEQATVPALKERSKNSKRYLLRGWRRKCLRKKNSGAR